MAITWPAKNNFATGDVLTATQMNNIGDDLNDLNTRVASAGGFFKNPVLNSNFSVWQRGTSIAMTSTSYVADRWQGYRAVAGSTTSRQSVSDTTNLPTIQYCARVQRDSGNTSTSAIELSQSFESINSYRFAGQTVTLSFYARSGANYSAASSALGVNLKTGTGTDQNIETGFTGVATPISQTATLTTTWQRFSYSATLSASLSQIALLFAFTPVGTAGAADYFEITGVQLEIGSSATTYYPNGNTYQAELAACQRYYIKDDKVGVNAYAGSGTNTWGLYQFPTTMRATPTMTQTGGATASQNTSATTFTQDTSNSNAFKMGLYFLAGASTTTTYLYRPVEWSIEL